MNIENRLPVLMSWNGGFRLVRVTGIQPRYFRLELRYRAESHHGRHWFVCCRKVPGDLHEEGDFVWCVGLPVVTEAAAWMIFSDMLAQWNHKRNPVENHPTSRKPPPLLESQLRFLAKQYPRTIKFFRALSKPTPANELARLQEEMARAFVEETFACSKVLLEPVDNADQLLRMGRLFARMAARERKADQVQYELIVGCYAKGYCRMKLADLKKAVEKAVGYKPTIDALRQQWKRLGLPSERKRGRPENSVGKPDQTLGQFVPITAPLLVAKSRLI